MRNTKLQQLLDTLSLEEVVRWREFVAATYHNKRSDVKRLADYLAPHKYVTQKQAYQIIFPNESYKAARLRNTISHTLRLLEQFFVHDSIQQKDHQYQQLLLSIIRERGSDKNFNAMVKTYQQLQEEHPNRSLLYYDQNHLLQRELFLRYEYSEDLESRNVLALMEAVEINYALRKLQYAIGALSHQNVYNKNYELKDMESILQQIEREGWLERPGIAAYYYAYKIMAENYEESEFKAYQRILKEEACFELKELKDLYTVLINGLIKRLNTGNESVLEDLFFWYKAGVQHKVFWLNKVFSRFTFKNIVSVAIRVHDLEWADYFINENYKFLAEEHQLSYYEYCKGILAMAQKKHKKAIGHLLGVNSSDKEIITSSKGLAILIYLELDEWEVLENLIRNFKQYLRRDRSLSAYHKKYYNAFTAIVQKIHDLDPHDRAGRKALLEEVKAAPHLPRKNWFINYLS